MTDRVRTSISKISVALGLDVDMEYADVVSQRKSARTRIQELEE